MTACPMTTAENLEARCAELTAALTKGACMATDPAELERMAKVLFPEEYEDLGISDHPDTALAELRQRVVWLQRRADEAKQPSATGPTNEFLAARKAELEAAQPLGDRGRAALLISVQGYLRLRGFAEAADSLEEF